MTSPYGSGTEDRRGSARSRITAATHATPTRAPCASEDISRLDGHMHESPHLFDWQMRRRSCDNERARSESARDCQRCRVAKSEMIPASDKFSSSMLQSVARNSVSAAEFGSGIESTPLRLVLHWHPAPAAPSFLPLPPSQYR
jgi:hypothetical protein